MDKNKNQEVLIDKSGTGRIRPWREHKLKNQLLSLAYKEVNSSKSFRLLECANKLEFDVLPSGDKKLVSASFCRVRLCPMCSWRRGLKIFSHMNRIMLGMRSEKEYGYIFLTFTVKNCSGSELGSVIDNMMKSWDRLMKLRNVKQSVKGWFRGLEITHNIDINSSSYDTFHPHFHCIFAVNKRYFKSDEYIKHEDWTNFWKQSLRIDYTPIVDVRRVKGDTVKAVSEVAKYAVKSDDYIIPDDWDLTVETVRILDSVLDGRRLVAYGGKFRELHKKLNLDDDLDGDLIHIDADAVNSEDNGNRVFYSWNVGYNQYIKNK